MPASPCASGHSLAGLLITLLFAERKPVGVVEAKPEGTTLGGVAEPSNKYLQSTPLNIPNVTKPLRFHYESTGTQTLFRDISDPDSRSRHVFAFHHPETLRDWFAQDETLRARLRSPPPLVKTGLHECQIEAIEALEESLAAGRPRSLVQMTMGSGKTYTTVSAAYRLIKHADARRILFLVDRRTLGRQALDESDLRDFVACFNPENRHDRRETERFKRFTYDGLTQRDKVSLDIFWLKDDSLEDSANLPAPEILAQEIAANLEAALEQFSGINESLGAG
jgi:type I site-specific restriction endonuclease